jgi:hypothetical protein
MRQLPVAVAIGIDQRGIMAGKSAQMLAWELHSFENAY